LWAFVGINYTVHKSQSCITDMLKAGELKRIDPELANVWGIRSVKSDEVRLNLTYKARPLPTWLSDARNEIKYKQSPIFNISATTPVYYGFSVFEDGRVTNFRQDIVLMQVSPDTVKAFMAELRSLGFWDWNFRDLSFDYSGMCEYTCPKITSVQIMTRNGKEVKKILLESASLYPKNIITQRMAQLVLLSEKYFPYTSKVCGFAKSEYFKQACKQPPFAVWQKIIEEK
jgi:hypothetical protein